AEPPARVRLPGGGGARPGASADRAPAAHRISLVGTRRDPSARRERWAGLRDRAAHRRTRAGRAARLTQPRPTRRAPTVTSAANATTTMVGARRARAPAAARTPAALASPTKVWPEPKARVATHAASSAGGKRATS